VTGLRVGGLTPLTTIDYPGELAAVVFCQGCPWRCRYCHNAPLLGRPQGAPIPWEAVIKRLERRRGLLDAVVFSGGEPTAQAALGGAMAAARDLGFKIGLHTAGAYPRRLARLLPLVDWVGLDIKELPEAYPALTGVPGSGERAWEALALLLADGTPHEVRVTVHDALLPPSRLQVLLTRLSDQGVERVALQRCSDARPLDPGLGPSASQWPAGIHALAAAAGLRDPRLRPAAPEG